MADTKISFQSKGRKLVGTVRVPNSVKPGERRPAWIVMHGFGSNSSSTNVLEPCKMFEDLGYVTLRFDMPGCGESEGERGNLICLEQVQAASDGLAFLANHPNVEADRIDDYKGLNARDLWTAGLILCVMASLAGVPPFLGFWAKLAVLRAALQGDLLWLAIVGIVFAVVGAFYYLRVIKVMYFDEPVSIPELDGTPMLPRDDRTLRVAFGVNALALLALGLFWNPIMAWCQQAFVAVQ